MLYALLLYGIEAESAKMTEAEQQQEMSDYYAYTAELRDSGAYVGGEALIETTSATTVRLRDGKTLITDGPFAETKEQLGGFYIINVPTLDEAIEWAAKVPAAKNGLVEVRPIAVFS